MKHTLIILLLPGLALCQTVYEVPFASRDNTIELTVQNVSEFDQEKVKVKIEDVADWIRITKTDQTISRLEGYEKKTAVFSFAVDKMARVGEQSTLSFTISGATDQTWTKTITIEVAPPDQIELFQNFPNPFNPATTIGYQLPASGRVAVKVYNLIGQEVAILVEGEKAAGYHQELWDASRFPSGMYVLELAAQTPGGKQTVARKRMMVLK